MEPIELAKGIAILADLLTTVTNAAAQAATVSSMIKKAQGEGRATFNSEEWATIQSASATSRQALVDAISKALL